MYDVLFIQFVIKYIEDNQLFKCALFEKHHIVRRQIKMVDRD
jgi:hypothetical protein